MLVLSRKKNEKIRINDDIIVMVVDIRGDKVRLGIIADKETPVHREEVYLAIQSQAARETRLLAAANYPAAERLLNEAVERAITEDLTGIADVPETEARLPLAVALRRIMESLPPGTTAHVSKLAVEVVGHGDCGSGPLSPDIAADRLERTPATPPTTNHNRRPEE